MWDQCDTAVCVAVWGPLYNVQECNRPLPWAHDAVSHASALTLVIGNDTSQAQVT